MRLNICDNCGAQVELGSRSWANPDTWILVEADADADCAAVCSWACLAGWAVTKATTMDNAE